MNTKQRIQFPKYSGIRCLMMPYIQGNPESVPPCYRQGYEDILSSIFIKEGDIGFLTIDESMAKAGKAHRGQGSKFDRAIHTEACQYINVYNWGGGVYRWGNSEPSDEPKPQEYRWGSKITQTWGGRQIQRNP